MLEFGIVMYFICVMVCMRSLYFQLKNRNLELFDLISLVIVSFLPFFNAIYVGVIMLHILERYRWDSEQMKVVKKHRTRWEREKDIW